MLALCFLMWSIPAGAASFWHSLPPEKLVALHEPGIERLRQLYPDEFKGYDPARIESVTLRVWRRRWLGPSACAPNDPRLEIKEVYADIREKPAPDGSVSAAKAMMSMDVEERDPCLPAPKESGRWALLSEQRREYRQAAELAEFLERYRDRYLDASPEDLISAKTVDRRWQWQGPSRCPAGDPRLTEERHEEEVELKRDEGGGGSGGAPDPQGDPCG